MNFAKFRTLSLAVLAACAVLVPGPATEAAADPQGPAPNFKLPLRGSGKDLSLSQLRGQVVMLNFWASWCGPCREELPLLSKFAEDLREEGLAVLAVAEDDARSRPAMLAYVRELKPSFLVLMDDDGVVADSYESWSVPETLFVDREGTIRWRHAGPVDWSSAKNRQRVEALIRGE